MVEPAPADRPHSGSCVISPGPVELSPHVVCMHAPTQCACTPTLALWPSHDRDATFVLNKFADMKPDEFKTKVLMHRVPPIGNDWGPPIFK